MAAAPDGSVLLVHHAEAVGPHIDPRRPLSARGRAQAAWIAEHARQAGVHPHAIWHSGKLRARQTAECLLVTCNPQAGFRLVRGLRPEDSPTWIADLVETEGDPIAIVSHMPLLPALLARLVGEGREFPVNGMVWLRRVGLRQFEEGWRASPPEGLAP